MKSVLILKRTWTVFFTTSLTDAADTLFIEENKNESESDRFPPCSLSRGQTGFWFLSSLAVHEVFIFEFWSHESVLTAALFLGKTLKKSNSKSNRYLARARMVVDERNNADQKPQRQ